MAIDEKEMLKEMYRKMLLIRLFEEKIADLVEEEKIGTPCHFCIGQEAAAVGVCQALTQSDTVWGAHRSHGHYLAKGGDLNALTAEIFCKRTGCSGGRGGSMHVIDTSVGVMGTVPIVAATIPIAVGAALTAKLRQSKAISVSFFGDGATEEGHFHESLNLAAVNDLPVLFVCENNLYSSHMGIFQRRKKNNIVDSARAHGITGYKIDGNNVEEVYKVTQEASANARKGKGPSLLELETFRWRGHVGPKWDDDVGVTRKGDLKEWLPRDPLKSCREQLIEQGECPSELERIKDEVQEEIKESIDFALRSPEPESVSLCHQVYKSVG